ncbi:MAG: chemotaxis protein CheW [Bacteroidota bacterium]|nr:chemotaxis protein CheW [Bacteroidota bacterium]
MSASTHTLLLFTAAERRLALALEQISEVVPAFEMKHAPGLAEQLAGLISFRGRVLPVIDCRWLVDGSRTTLHHQHSFIIAQGSSHEAALLVECVDDLISLGEEEFRGEDFLHAGERKFRHIVMHRSEMVLVLDIDACMQTAAPLPVNGNDRQTVLEGGYALEH